MLGASYKADRHFFFVLCSMALQASLITRISLGLYKIIDSQLYLEPDPQQEGSNVCIDSANWSSLVRKHSSIVFYKICIQQCFTIIKNIPSDKHTCSFPGQWMKAGLFTKISHISCINENKHINKSQILLSKML